VELYPGAKEIILVRDFRDTLASSLAFNAKLGSRTIGRGHAGTDEELVAYLAEQLDGVRRRYSSRGEGARLVRYEDLILEPERTLTSLLAWLGVESTPPVVREMLDSAHRETPQMRAHRTSPSASESIGRWKQDLSPELREQATDVFADALAEFGYEV
jgi:hypothetical protein